MNTLYNQNVEGALSLITVNGAKYQLGKDASQDVAGIAKLYNAVTDGVTDGGVTPNAVYDAIAALSGDTETNLGELEAKIQTLIGPLTEGTDGEHDDEKSVRTISAEEVAKIVANAPESYDTLQEIATWIMSDTTGAAKMANDITALQSGKKDKQTAVTNIAGDADKTLATLSQDANGNITYTMQPIQEASTSQHGLMTAAMYTKLNDLPTNSSLTADLNASFDEKADKVSNAIEGNFAGLDANGNLTDSGHKHSDYKTQQAVVADPTVGSATDTYQFIATISQNANGEISATKQAVREVSSSQSGLMTAAQNNKLAAISMSVSNDTLVLVDTAA